MTFFSSEFLVVSLEFFNSEVYDMFDKLLSSTLKILGLSTFV